MKKAVALTPAEIDALRPFVFQPCGSKEELKNWILLFLGLDMPDTIVDPTSNSSPMDLLWEIYSIALAGGHVDFSQFLAYASRDSFKTLAASVMETLCLTHLGRNTSHMAAIKPQSKKAQEYVKKMLNRPMLRDYVSSKNDSTLEITRYRHLDTGDNLTPKQYESLEPGKKDEYEELKNYVLIVVCTMQGANSAHTPFMVVDEVDVVEDPNAYEDAKMIPNEENGMMPVTLLTSTRKYAFGLVQKELDDQEASGIQVRHWNIIDVTKKCLPTRHLPDEPQVPIYFNEELLRSVGQKDYELLDPETQKKYKMEMGSPGCLKNCKLYAMCRGRLKKQEGTSKMLKSIDHVTNVFRKISVQRAKAQLMCWKPSSEGLIYPYFDRNIHMLTAAQMASMVTGDQYDESFNKADLIALMKERETKFTGGMDFGTTHCFATVQGFRDGNRYFIIGAREVPDLEPTQQIDLCKPEHDLLRISYYPDTAMPGTIRMFKKAGFTMYDWKKKPGSVLDGIDTVRSLIMPSGGAIPRSYLLRGDDGCELLAKRITQYHWKLGTDGKPTDIPDEEDDDLLDALRYCLMNQFASGGKIIASLGDNPLITSAPTLGAPRIQQHNYLSGLINEALGRGSGTVSEEVAGESKGKKGKILWDMS